MILPTPWTTDSKKQENCSAEVSIGLSLCLAFFLRHLSLAVLRDKAVYEDTCLTSHGYCMLKHFFRLLQS